MALVPIFTALLAARWPLRRAFSYSAAMKAKGGIWDEATLDKFLEQPMMAIPGTRMAFAGVIEPADRKALYLYLLENSR